MLVRHLVGMFRDPVRNPRGAQLVFSAHDTSLLEHTLFRRDHVWFAEKDKSQATRILPLSNFRPRKHEAWEQGYRAGRYGRSVDFLSHRRSSGKLWHPEGPGLIAEHAVFVMVRAFIDAC